MHKKIKALAISLIMFSSIFSASPALAASSPVVKPVDCWTDLSTSVTVCVPVGGNLTSAVKRQTGTDLLVQTASGLTTDLVTGLTSSTPSESPRSATEATPATALAGSYIILKLYIDANYGTAGGVWSVGASQPCGLNSVQYVPDFGANSPSNGYYNNRVSSYKTFYNCYSDLFDNANYGGDDTGLSINQATLGSMNDRANSAIVISFGTSLPHG